MLLHCLQQLGFEGMMAIGAAFVFGAGFGFLLCKAYSDDASLSKSKRD